MLKDGSSLCIGFNSKYSMKIRQYVLFKIKKFDNPETAWGKKPFILF